MSAVDIIIATVGSILTVCVILWIIDRNGED